MLKSFEIQGFRTFSHLRIAELGQVNLIVGKNNVGKTTLLEALSLYATRGSFDEMGDLLKRREEFVAVADQNWRGESGKSIDSIQSLFHGLATSQDDYYRSMTLGPIGDVDSRLKIRLVPLVPHYEVISGTDAPIRYQEMSTEEEDGGVEWKAGLAVEFVGKPASSRLVDALEQRWSAGRSNEYGRPPFIPARGLSHEEALRWWDDINLRPEERRIYQFLSFVEKVERIAATGHPNNPLRRIFRALIKGASHPVPLQSLGHGLVRMFHIAIASERTQGNKEYIASSNPFGEKQEFDVLPILLIDEIENGVYHGVLEQLWQFVFRLASLNHLQVFATTHSNECVQAFLKVSEEDQEVDGRLIRLEAKDDKNRAVTFDESGFSTLREANIEVR